MIFFRINSEQLSKNPSSVKNGRTKIQKQDRTMDGTMVVDIIAYKNTVTFTWDVLSDADLRKLLTEITGVSFCNIEYRDAQSVDSTQLFQIEAFPGDISYQPHYDYASDSIVWTSVSITFTER